MLQGQNLQIIYGLETITQLDAWKAMYKYLQASGFSLITKARVNGKNISFDNVSEYISKKSLQHFFIEVEDMSFDYSTVGSMEHVFLEVIGNSVKREFNWQRLINSLLEQRVFIQAWVSDIEYDFWQNASTTLEYDSYGRSYEGLPMKSNGLPYPLERLEIDTSQNPGRRVLRLGYVEAVGHCMWLGEEFWSLTGVKKESAIQRISELEEAELFIDDDVTFVQFAKQPFNNTQTAELQVNIRNILFDC